MVKLLCLSLTGCLVLAACGPGVQQPQVVTAQSASPAATDNHSSANALDWAGVYKGIVPCADCAGIETRLSLHQDLTYQLSTRYLGKDLKVFEQQGKFVWDSTGSVIQLLGQKHGATQYKVAENQLFQLDMAGQLIQGNLAEQYKLHKQAEDTTE